MTMPLFARAADAYPSGGRAALLLAVAHALAARLADRIPVTRQTLKSLMRQHLGGSDASGDWSMREAYDALEVAQVMRMLDPASGLIQWDAPDAAMAAREALSGLLATQHYRSETQVDLQQFSTPLGLAWLAARAARMRASDLVLEPSAGTGMLAVHAAVLGAGLVLNERDPARAHLLALALDRPVTRHDGEYLDDVLDVECRPSVVLINPPFSRSESRGRDRHAGARHLFAALARLAPGGRCVAILPPGFARDGGGAKGYASVAAQVPPRFELLIHGEPFAKHGTSVSVRLLIYDRGWIGEPRRLVAETLAVAQRLVEEIPPRLDDPDLPPAPRLAAVAPAAPRRVAPLLSGVRPVRPLAPPSMPDKDGDAEPVTYTLLDEPPAAEDPVGVYVPWRLTRMRYPVAKPHPDQLVESMAMSSILPPAPTYRPLLPPRAVATLSDAQLETVIYAGQAFERDLPGRFRPDEMGTSLHAHDEGASYRAGFMVGDGTGVGKGRQIAACILDLWCRGQRRAVWISKSASLLEDARRDWCALGGLAIDLQPLDVFPLGQTIAMESGILFLTFATLRSQRDDAPSRLQQLLDWLTPGFDGLIAFDEAHEMANAAGTTSDYGTQKGSEQGLAGVRLQNLLPRARIFYNSATGATDATNLSYALRLGLWGNSAFATREAFMTAIGDGGIAAMEIVARDLKAMGFYTARALTFRGVDYLPLEHRLAPEQIEIYDAYADAWGVIHRHLQNALAAAGVIDRITRRVLNGQAKGAALSRFEGAKQRFFSQVLIAMKLPSLIEAVEVDIAEGRHPVIQLVTTSEAMLDRHLAGLSPEERAALDVDLSPRELMIQYLKAAFPTRQMRVYKGPDGEPRSEPMRDENGDAVHCQEAIRARDGLIEQLCAMPAIPAALDALVAHFGPDRIAEVTGRSRRIVVDAAGRQRLDRRTALSNIAEARAFMDGTKQLLVFSDAGGTGRSYHADRDCPTAHRRRVHYLLEPGWRAAAAIQGLGRSNRTNQASAPIFRPVTTDCRGERRFISTIARRLDGLGALTRGQRQTGGQNLFDPMDNLESDHAREALQQWYKLLDRGKLKSTTLAEFAEMTGLKLRADDSGSLLDTLPSIQRWLNRLLALRIATQNAIFEEYMALIQARIDAARERGTLDVGVETIMVETIVPREKQLLRRDPVIGAETWLQRLELHRRRRPARIDDLLEQWSHSERTAFVCNRRSGRVALRVPSWSILDEDGDAIEVWELVRPSGSERIHAARLAESAWEPVDEQAFRAAWEAESGEIAGRLDVETVSVATGLLLPVWNQLPDDDQRVWRISDERGQSVIGRMISPAGLAKVATAFGTSVDVSLSPAELIAGARGVDGIMLSWLPGASLVRVYVNDEARLEIKGFPPARLAQLKALGCFTEIIRHKTRLFVPLSRAIEIVAALERALDEHHSPAN